MNDTGAESLIKTHMQLGYIGLGKMGSGMVVRLLAQSHDVVVYNKTPEPVEIAVEQGATGSESIVDLVTKLDAPRTIWIMVPHQAVDDVLKELTPHLEEGDTVIDGGNSPYQESIRRGRELSGHGVQFLDVGVSGGPGGALEGACMMIGGEREVYEKYIPLFADLCVENGYGYMGESGAGHFVKMVHNGIEYGMMQAIAEGFHIMKEAPFDLGLKNVARVYNNGSVIESRLMEWLESGFEYWGTELDEVSGSAAASGEGEWTVKAAHELGIADEIIHESLKAREISQKNPSYQGKIISVLRNQFGGHDVT